MGNRQLAVSSKNIVEVKWLDSKGVTTGWEYIDELQSLKPAECKTVGYLIERTKQYITVAQSVSEEQLLARITIPVCSIIKMKKL